MQCLGFDASHDQDVTVSFALLSCSSLSSPLKQVRCGAARWSKGDVVSTSNPDHRREALQKWFNQRPIDAGCPHMFHCRTEVRRQIKICLELEMTSNRP